ncbi:MAG: hypothetical protein H6564_11480 [Lewinellaceae bacterium]|nr:hypothetical protein [Lewinellaceae bacterium]
MKLTAPRSVFCFALIAFCLPLQAQEYGNSPLLVNEVGVMPLSGTRYIELLVVGYPDAPGAAVSLQGWIVDNHSAQIEGDSAFLVLGECFSALAPGTLIVIYDDDNPHGDISMESDGAPNSQGIYQLPLSSPCLSRRVGNYTENSEAPQHIPWNNILPLRHSGDALQFRGPEGKLRFALDWDKDESSSLKGNVAHFNWEGNSRVNAIALIGKICSDDQDALYETRIVGSPGKNNSTENALFVESVSTGGAGQPLSISCAEHRPVSEANPTGAIQVEPTGGEAPYLVEWFGPGGVSGSASLHDPEPFLIQGLQAGAYEVRVTDGRGCREWCRTVLGSLEIITICEGECFTIGGNLEAGLCYWWTPEEGLSEGANPTEKEQMVCPEATSNFNVYISSPEGEIIGSKEYWVEVNAGSITITPNPAILCPNELINLKAADGYFDYSWSNGEITQSILVNAPNEYSVSATTNQRSDISGELCTVEGSANVISSENETAVVQWLEDSGFRKYNIEVLGPIMGPDPQAVHDYARLLIFLEGQEVNIAQQIEQYYDSLEIQNEICNQDISYSCYITSSLCSNPSIGNVNEMFEHNGAAVKLWFHIIDRAEDYLYVKAQSIFSINLLEGDTPEIAESDFPTWGAVHYLSGGPVPFVNYGQNDYFSTSGDYLGRALLHESIRCKLPIKFPA